MRVRVPLLCCRAAAASHRTGWRNLYFWAPGFPAELLWLIVANSNARRMGQAGPRLPGLPYAGAFRFAPSMQEVKRAVVTQAFVPAATQPNRPTHRAVVACPRAAGS